MSARFRIRKEHGDWLLEERISAGMYVEIITVGTHAGACREMDHEIWLQDRQKYPGKTLSDSRRIYRKGRLGSHVESDSMRADRTQTAMDGRPALESGPLVHTMREGN